MDERDKEVYDRLCEIKHLFDEGCPGLAIDCLNEMVEEFSPV